MRLASRAFAFSASSASAACCWAFLASSRSTRLASRASAFSAFLRLPRPARAWPAQPFCRPCSLAACSAFSACLTVRSATMSVWSFTMLLTLLGLLADGTGQAAEQFGPYGGQITVEVNDLLHVLEVPGDRLGQIKGRQFDRVELIGERLRAVLPCLDGSLGRLTGLAVGGGVGIGADGHGAPWSMHRLFGESACVGSRARWPLTIVSDSCSAASGMYGRQNATHPLRRLAALEANELTEWV